jgi:hypothetical protein
VFRLDILSDTEQRVAGIDVQGTSSSRARTSSRPARRSTPIGRPTSARRPQMRMLGNVSLGARGPQATVFPAAIAMGARP